MNKPAEVIWEVRDHIGVITLNRPERLNALNPAVFEQLYRAWTAAAADPAVRCVVVTGSGRGFCSGADMAARSETEAHSARDTNRPMPLFTARHVKLFKPVITAVNGVCAGAGLHFVVDCDIPIASDRASFVDTHVNVGQITALEPIGLSRKIPLAAVTRMVALGAKERLSADRAFELGIVTEVVAHERLMDRAMELAEMAASVSPDTVQQSLRGIWESLDEGLDEALAKGWQTIQGHYAHPDSVEGPRAFIEKREPRWTVEGPR